MRPKILRLSHKGQVFCCCCCDAQEREEGFCTSQRWEHQQGCDMSRGVTFMGPFSMLHTVKCCPNDIISEVIYVINLCYITFNRGVVLYKRHIQGSELGGSCYT